MRPFHYITLFSVHQIWEDGRVLFPITTLGPGNRIGIWTIGCPHKCYNCSNPELWDANVNKDINVSDLVSSLSD
ncbi:MAG: 4Fe-4S cluster-binding domain-containing protein, partial [Eubacteriales bacterium]|nr:4Fe-4S cluster-binding domain-containing protein [Eubacteriales bacterium]